MRAENAIISSDISRASMHGSIERSIGRAADMHTTEFTDLSFFFVAPMVRGSSTPHDMSYTFASRRVTSQTERAHCN